MTARALRVATAAAASLSVLAAGGALAAPKPVCNLVKDEKGDAAIVSSQPALDIVTGDIATNAKNITAVIRLDGTPSGANAEAAGGTRYSFLFSPQGAENPQYLSALVPFVGEPTFRTGQAVTDDAGTTTYTNDTDQVEGVIKDDEVTITAPLSAFASRASMKSGTKLSGLQVETFALVGVFLVPVDDAAGKSYVVGTRSCVTPGA